MFCSKPPQQRYVSPLPHFRVVPPSPKAAGGSALATSLNGRSSAHVRLAEVLSALTYALDLTDGQRPGHTLRTCLIAMRIGESLGLDQTALSALFYAALLKDSGCSSNAARMAALFGSDDQQVKYSMRLVDWHDRIAVTLRAAKNCGIGRSPFAMLKHLFIVAGSTDPTRELIVARCERGAQIAHALGFPDATSEAIQHVDEHWCGLGHPMGLTGTEIPILSRILLVSQTVEAFWTEKGLTPALDMLKKRRSRWFDPALVDLVSGWRRESSWWADIADIDKLEAKVVAVEPGSSPMFATDERLDKIAYAFASVIDAKTPFTYRHSTNVAGYAAVISQALGHDAVTSRDILRAGLLHDIGKLGVSNRILDKPAKLTDQERNEVMKHPKWTWEILERVPAFHRFALPASFHHERLDGRGYPWGIEAGGLDFGARILALADVYEAITADRPYRTAMTAEEALAIMQKDAGTAFDVEIFDIVADLARNGTLARIADGSLDPMALTTTAQPSKVRLVATSNANNIRVA